MNLRFGGFQANENVKRSLSLAFGQERVPHAVLLEGGAAETAALARFLAQAWVCLAEGAKPCGTCSGCVKARAGSHPDILMLDGDADPRAFPVDAVRRVRAAAWVRPNEAPGKAFLLLGAQNMSEISQNALLKILEEPPDGVLFILTAASASALLPTVRSRVQVFPAGGGAPSGDWERAEKIASAVTALGEADLMFAFAGLEKDRRQMGGVLQQLLLIFRDALALRSGGKALLSGRGDAAAALGGALTRRSLMRMAQETEKARRALERNANAALLGAAFCSGLRAAAGR